MTQLVTVEHIWPLDPTKKNGGFKDANGVNYYCEIGAYHLLSKGATYDLPARPYISKAGKQSFIVDKSWHPPATLAGMAPAPAPQAAPQFTQSPPPAQTSRPVQGTVPAPSNSDHKDALIFVTGLVGRAMGSGKFVASDMTDLTSEAVKAWLFLKEQMK